MSRLAFTTNLKDDLELQRHIESIMIMLGQML